MKILIGAHHFPPRYKGGGENYAFNLAAQMQARGHVVRVVCVEHVDRGPAGGVEWVDEVYQGIAVRRISQNLAAAPDPQRWEFANPWIGQMLGDLAREWQPDLFHLVSGYLLTTAAVQALAQRGVPVVVTLTDFWFLCPRITMQRSDGQLSSLPINPVRCARCLGEQRRRYRRLGQAAPGLMDAYWARQSGPVQAIRDRQAAMQRAFTQVSQFISPSRFLRDVYIQAGLPAEKITFLRHGLASLPNSLPAAPERPVGVPLRVGYIGQISEHKGIHHLVEAVTRHLPQAGLAVEIYGDAARQPEYAQRLGEAIGADPRIRLMGAFSGPQRMAEILRELDVLVVPSVWYENCPLVILEANAYGVPVLASRLGGMAELVEHDTSGLLFEPGSSADLAAQLQRLLQEDGLLRRLRQGVRPPRAIEQEMDDVAGVYRSILHPQPAGVLSGSLGAE